MLELCRLEVLHLVHANKEEPAVMKNHHPVIFLRQLLQ